MMLVLCAMFAALMAVGAWISIPIFSIPITLQLLAILCCSALLSPGYATLSVVVYVLLGLIGLPVFTGFTGGVGKLLSITGGYIIGFIPCAFITSWVIRHWGYALWKQALAMILGVAICYAFGTAWFLIMNGQQVAAGTASKAYTLGQTLGICVVPYIPFDLIKIAISIALSRLLRKPLQNAMAHGHTR